MVLKQKDLKKYRELNTPDVGHHFHLEIKNPVLDHDHKTGYCRGVLDREINQYLGKLEQNYIRFIKWKYPEIPLSFLLRGLADYISRDYSKNPLHPKAVSINIKRFSRANSETQIRTIKSFGLIPAKSKAERTRQYKEYIMREENIYKV